MSKHLKAVIGLITALLLLSGCSASFDEEQDAAKLAVEEAFDEEPIKPNKDSEVINFHIPFGFEIEEETPNNVLLKNGSKNYILFYNQHEGSDSQVVYNSTVQQNEKYDVNETFTKDKKFGYILIRKLDDDLNSLTVGIGGVKLTTEIKTRNLASEAEIMMDIVNSVKLQQ
ncbi:hypothetical protein ACFYKX_22755 [Cytobacillus sp. FJAT-54145]|uniref:DUF4367 domain-containing protein n=1 Tax=Cytobacillus spartinae TaxID=3299023 RepID=A0ABW6KGK5_9BACI